ncbi:MAG: hypothetical protein E7505_05115 [Ruminococcus sp.]|nr:hypothetical protein [Ruminococcus sp.]
MVNKDLLKEIKFITICSLCMDIVLIAAAALFVPVINAFAGAMLGTLLLAADMFFLAFTVHNIARDARKGKNGTAKMITSYILRFLFVAAGLYLALNLTFVSIICTAIPLFYPKVIYPLKAILKKKEG